MLGFHFGLLWAVGIVASPLMGHLSDRLGRKPVLVPALLCSGALTVILALFSKGILYQNFGMKAVLFFVAALFAISAAIFASADFSAPTLHEK